VRVRVGQGMELAHRKAIATYLKHEGIPSELHKRIDEFYDFHGRGVSMTSSVRGLATPTRMASSKQDGRPQTAPTSPLKLPDISASAPCLKTTSSTASFLTGMLDPLEKQQFLSERRILAAQRLFEQRVSKNEHVAKLAEEQALRRQHEVEVLRRKLRNHQTALRNSRQRWLQPASAHGPHSQEAQRTALRETHMDSMRREEIARALELAEREHSLAARRFDEAETLAKDSRASMHAKARQEQEQLTRLRLVDAQRLEREETSGKLRGENARQKEGEKGALLAARKARAEAMEQVATQRRQKKEEDKKREGDLRETIDEQRVKTAQDHARAKADAKALARRESAHEHARRLEVVLHRAESAAQRLEDECDRCCDELETRPSSFAQEQSERLSARLTAQRARSKAAKLAYEEAVRVASEKPEKHTKASSSST